MIPRWQQTIFWLLLVSTVAMAAYLIRMRSQAQDRLLAVQDVAPLAATADAPAVPATLMLANDSDGSLTPVQSSITLPTETTARARALLVALFRTYSAPGSSHPLAALPAISDVYLLPLPPAPSLSGSGLSQPPQSNPAPSNPDASISDASDPDASDLAVVNLSGNFVANHPSGIEVETLTLLSIANTLHVNLPQIVQVHFLVDGQQKNTLAGHADLTQNYLATEPAMQAAPVQTAPAQTAPAQAAPVQPQPPAPTQNPSRENP